MPAALALVAALLVGTALPGGASAAAPAGAADGIAVEGDSQGCPGRANLIAALEARLPGFVALAAGAAEGVRRLTVDRPGSPPGVRVRLVDAAGTLELQRNLEVSGTSGEVSGTSGGRGEVSGTSGGRAGAAGRAAEGCAALAEAAAQVVARYLKEIGYRPPAATLASPAEPPPAPRPPVEPAAPPPAPPSPPPDTVATARPTLRPAATGSPRWLLLAGVAAGPRLGIGSGDRWPRGELLLGLELRRGRLAAAVAAGVSDQTSVEVPGTSPDAALLLRGYPVRLALGAALPLGRGGTFLPALGASLDWLDFRVSELDGARRGRRFDPALEASVGYGHRWGRLVVGGRVAGGWSLRPRDFFSERDNPLFRTPGGYLRAVLEAGFVLGKDSSAPVL